MYGVPRRNHSVRMSNSACVSAVSDAEGMRTAARKLSYCVSHAAPSARRKAKENHSKWAPVAKTPSLSRS